MSTGKQPPSTLDDFRELAKSDPNIAALVGLIDRLQGQLMKCLERLKPDAKISETFPDRRENEAKYGINNRVA